MTPPHRVLITDFLTETSVEAAALAGVAEVQTAGAHDEADLADLLAEADALIVYHDIPMMTDATFSRAGRCLGVIRAGVGLNRAWSVSAWNERADWTIADSPDDPEAAWPRTWNIALSFFRATRTSEPVFPAWSRIVTRPSHAG